MNMRNVNTGSFVLAFILILTVCGLCLAEDFTFNVPVQLYNLDPKITTARIYCRVSGLGTKSGKQSGPPPTITFGSGYKEFSIVNGTYVGSIVIKFNVASGLNPADAHNWMCQLFFHNAGATKTSSTSSTTIGSTHASGNDHRLEFDHMPDWQPADNFMSGKINQSKPYRTMDSGYLQ
jgi:hypothetical protein